MRGFLHLGSHKKIDSDQLACSRKRKDLYAQPREAQHVNKRYQPFLFKEYSWAITSQFCAACQAMNAYVNGCIMISKERINLDFDISVNDYQFNTVEPLLIDTSLLWTWVLLVLKILTITIPLL